MKVVLMIFRFKLEGGSLTDLAFISNRSAFKYYNLMLDGETNDRRMH